MCLGVEETYLLSGIYPSIFRSERLSDHASPGTLARVQEER